MTGPGLVGKQQRAALFGSQRPFVAARVQRLRGPSHRLRTLSVRAALEALIFDCDGVIIESEHIHRQAYNDAFAHFDIRCADAQVVWDEAFYDDLQNRIGGGKPKMRWFFGEHSSWPRSSILPQPPATDEEKAQLIDTVQDWKTLRYQEIVRSGEVKARPGVIRLMDEARASGLKVAVCSAATRSSVVMVVSSLLGKERYEGLDCFIAGDDVSKKKPDPLIYNVASQRLQVDPANCLVVEDSAIGLQAALGAGMKCAVTYTNSTAGQSFEGASSIVATLGDDPPLVRVEDLMRGEMIADDRVSSVAA